LSEFHLPAAFSSASTARKDVENKLCPVDHLALESLLELAHLSRRQFVVDDDEVDISVSTRCTQTRHLATADERPSVRLGAFLQHPEYDGRTRRLGEAGKLFERLLGFDTAYCPCNETNERGTLNGRRPLCHVL
jgi:hypothetical protein